MTRYSPNHPAVIAHRKTHPPTPMTAGRKTAVTALLITAVLTIPAWPVSIGATLTAWLLIRGHKR